jgi:hypothetical protein
MHVPFEKKNKTRIVLHKGTLRKFGYSTHLKESERREALTKAMDHFETIDKPLVVFRKLNALAVLNKNRAPKTYAKLVRDKDFAHRRWASTKKIQQVMKKHNLTEK